MSPVRLDIVSSEHGSGAPSFGDLFEEPETPLHPPAPAPEAPAAPEPAPVFTPMPVAEADEVAAEPAAPGIDPAAAASPAYDVPVTGVAVTGLAAEGAAPAPEPSWSAAEQAPTPAWSGSAEPPAPLGADAPGAPVPVPEPFDPAAAQPEPVPLTEAEPAAESVAGWDHAAVPAAAAPVDTGRLYRSAGAEGPQTLEAIPALDPVWLASREQPPLGTPDVATGTAAGAAAAAAAPTSTAAAPQPRVQGGAGLTWTGVFVVTTAATVLLGVADALITGRLGWLTGLALAVSGIYSACVVRRVDIWAAVIAPPLAFLAAVLTAGQLTLDSAGSLLLREAYMVFRSLATNAPWILGTTVACLVIVLVRRRRT